MQIYDRIDEILAEKKMSRRKMARLAGIPETTIASAFSRKPERFPIEYIVRIAKALEIPWQKLVAGTDVEKVTAIALESSFHYDSIGSREFLNGVDITEPSENWVDKMRYLGRQLNLSGKEEALKRVEELTQIPKYQKRQD